MNLFARKRLNVALLGVHGDSRRLVQDFVFSVFGILISQGALQKTVERAFESLVGMVCASAASDQTVSDSEERGWEARAPSGTGTGQPVDLSGRKIKKHRTELQAEINDLEERIKTVYALAAPQGQWITAGSHRFRVTQQRGRRILKQDRLLQKRTPMLGEHEVEKLLSWCEEEGERFQRLYVNTISAKRQACG